jgi:hypothetical protein
MESFALMAKAVKRRSRQCLSDKRQPARCQSHTLAEKL